MNEEQIRASERCFHLAGELDDAHRALEKADAGISRLESQLAVAHKTLEWYANHCSHAARTALAKIDEGKS